MQEKNNFKIIINGNVLKFSTNYDQTLLDFLLENNIKIKANCEGNCACGKCHVKFDQEHYDRMEISDREQDILDKNINLTMTSRLACQVRLTDDLDGARIDVLE